MDCKKYALLFLQKMWIAVLAVIAGAFLGGGIYLLINVALVSNREYRAESKLYLNFAVDESGEVYQAYNGYTWNDLMSTEPILNTTMSYLPDFYTEEEVIAATSAQILSDIRLLTITITTPDAGRTAEILKATDLALVDLGEREKEFVDIKIYKETPPKVVAIGERLWQAAALGSVLALVLTLSAMALIYVLDDKIYVPGDLKCVTGIPFAGYCFTGEDVCPDAGKQGAGSSSDTGKPEKAERAKGRSHMQKIRETLQKDMWQNLAYISEENGTLARLELKRGEAVTEECAAQLRKADGVLLVLSYGEMDRTTLNYRLEQLTLLGCRIVGIFIQDADMRFMKWYYNHL